MNKEQFFIVGAQRSGTTYLNNILEQHPEICMAKPTRPEPKYFLKKNINIDEYYKTFYAQCNSKVFGEKSTSYYENETVASLISNILPDSKIIFCLRNPIQRALSNYQFSVDNGLEQRTLEEVFIENKKIDNNDYTTSVNPFDYLGRGEYYKFIEIYMKYFKSENIKILLFEELVNNDLEIKKLYQFLNVDREFTPLNIAEVVNASLSKNNIDDSVLFKLKEYYQPFNEKLKQLTNCNLESWNI